MFHQDDLQSLLANGSMGFEHCVFECLSWFHDCWSVVMFVLFYSIHIYVHIHTISVVSRTFDLYHVFFADVFPIFLASDMVSLQELKKLPGPGVRGTELGSKKFQFQKAKNQTCTYWIWNLLLKFQFAQFLIPYLYYIYSFFMWYFDSMVFFVIPFFGGP